MANDPPVQAGATIGDSVADTFQPRYTPQQTPLATSQYFADAIKAD